MPRTAATLAGGRAQLRASDSAKQPDRRRERTGRSWRDRGTGPEPWSGEGSGRRLRRAYLELMAAVAADERGSKQQGGIAGVWARTAAGGEYRGTLKVRLDTFERPE